MNINTKIILFVLSIAIISAYGWRSVKAAPATGDLVKAGNSSVYYIGVDGKRYVFPNEKVYFSWYSNFSGVKTVSDHELASYTIGGNVTYRPGVRLVKIQTDPKVYAVSSGGVLRWVPDQNTAGAIYGADWNKMIDDVPDSFFVNYKIGVDIGPANMYYRAQELTNATNIGTDKKIVSQSASQTGDSNYQLNNIVASSGGAGGWGGSNAGSNTNVNTNADSNSNTNSNTNINSSLNSNTNTNTNSSTNSNTNTNNNTSTYSKNLQLIGRHIKDASGTTIVARGPEMVVADAYNTEWIDTAASEGANAVRLLLTLDTANNMTPDSFDTLIGRAVSHNMIIWISLYTWDETHNHIIGPALGGGNFYSLTAPDGTGTCSKETPAPCYLAVWSRPWLKNLVDKYRGNIIIDGMQEYIGTANPETEAGRTEWATVAKTNIQWFRKAGYTQPLEIMSNFQGRDLYAIVEKAASIRAVDTVVVNGYPQTMFGWQAYWASDWYKSWQGELLLGEGYALTGAQAIHQIVVNQTFPIEVGIDNYGGDAASEYRAEMDQAATDNVSWLWWSWRSEGVECPVDGATCEAYVMDSQSGFAGAAR